MCERQVVMPNKIKNEWCRKKQHLIKHRKPQYLFRWVSNDMKYVYTHIFKQQFCPTRYSDRLENTGKKETILEHRISYVATDLHIQQRYLPMRVVSHIMPLLRNKTFLILLHIRHLYLQNQSVTLCLSISSKTLVGTGLEWRQYLTCKHIFQRKKTTQAWKCFRNSKIFSLAKKRPKRKVLQMGELKAYMRLSYVFHDLFMQKNWLSPRYCNFTIRKNKLRWQIPEHC